VATRAGGIPEIVDENSGLLVQPADAGELADTLERLAGSARLREQLGAAGRVRAERCFSWDRAADAYRTIFSGPAGERKRAARFTLEPG